MNKIFTTVLLVSAMVLSGCAGTQQAKKAEKSGFLDDYSILRKGGDDDALLVYRNADANWASYKKVMIDPVTVWMGKGSKLQEVSKADRQSLADNLYARLNEQLKQDYMIVTQPGPGVLRISAAITEATESNVAMDTISSVVPQMRLLSGAKSLATGTSSFVGTAGVEAKITDGDSGDLLAAAVDRRGGTKGLSGATNSWNDVEESYQYWAAKTRHRLCQWRRGTNCVEPEA